MAAWLQVLSAAGLVLFGGLMSGLTLGLLSLEELDMALIEKTGAEKERRYCQKIRPLIRDQHLLLVTLLLCNAVAMEALPLVLDQLVSPVQAVIISVTAVLAFGEIIPQAVCKTYGLAVGAATAPLVRALMFVCKPISWPVGKLLDCMLGHHSGTVYKRGEIKAIVDIHREKGEITCEEEAVIDGAIDFTSKQAGQCMTALAHVKTLGKSQILNADVVNQILSWGHSRIPVVDDDGESFIGVLLVKELIKPGAIPDSGGMVCGMNLRPLVHITESMHLYSLLSIFKMGRSHMALVYSDVKGRTPAARGTLTPPAKASATPIGIVTLEDLVEELIQGEIVDETDRFVHVERPQAGSAEAQRQAMRTPRPPRAAGPIVEVGLPIPASAQPASPTFVSERRPSPTSFASPSGRLVGAARFVVTSSSPGGLRKPLLS